MLSDEQKAYIYEDIKNTWEALASTNKKRSNRPRNKEQTARIKTNRQKLLKLLQYLLGLRDELPKMNMGDYTTFICDISRYARFPASLFPFPEVTQHQGTMDNPEKSVSLAIAAVSTKGYFQTLEDAMRPSAHGSFFAILHSFLFENRELDRTILHPVKHKGMYLGLFAYFPANEKAEPEELPMPEFDATWGGIPIHAHALRNNLNNENGLNRAHFILYSLATEQSTYYISNPKEYYTTRDVTKEDVEELRSRIMAITTSPVPDMHPNKKIIYYESIFTEARETVSRHQGFERLFIRALGQPGP